jgi:hypothetical protein
MDWNNFNETMIEAIRNNMDIKFIGSGSTAKAILYYITDYITKTQLQAQHGQKGCSRNVPTR